MRAQRTFIDWRLPALQAAVDKLCSLYERDGLIDLSNVIVVTPGARAGRRFLELLAERTDGRNIAPQLATPGDLPERLYQLKRPLADDLTQQFAWVEALRGLPEQQMRAIVGDPPADGDIQAWLAIGKMLSRLHRELAADVKNFRDVSALTMIREAREAPRWDALSAAQDRYLQTLDELELWDRQTARLVSIEKREPATDSDIFLIGVADMNGTLRAMLQPVADRVHVFIHAPEELSARFDELGVLRAAAWENAPIELDDRWFRFADRPVDQAECVVDFVREQADADQAVDDVVIGLADESLASPVRVAMEERGVKTRWIGGRTAGMTSIARLLTAIADRLDSDLTESTCELLRHPDVAGWMEREAVPRDWLAIVDKAVIDHAPRRLGGGLGDDRPLAVSRAVAELVDRLLSPLAGPGRPLGDWAIPVCQVLQEIYGDRFFTDEESDQQERQALEVIRVALHDQSGVPERLAPATTASAAIRLALDIAGNELLSPDSPADTVEMIGWLELPLDDAPCVVVCGMNDGFVPSSLNNDQFLPNSLREELGLEDNRRRYARDAYALGVLTHSRKTLRLIAGQHDRLGDPLLPSRLLFATDEETIARRVQAAFSTSGSLPASVQLTGAGFPVPRPRPQQPTERVYVTAFRDFIACPYRFYLKHVEKLRAVEQLEGELTAATFGTLIHEALNRWAKSDVMDSTDPRELSNYIERAFDDAAAESFDDEPLPAVKLQLEQARLRLETFAEWQALHRRQGWQVRYIEQEASYNLALPSGRTIRVDGRIDRIDYNAASDEWLVIDYKTGDRAADPGKVHLDSGVWVDLQLPLYRLLARSLNIPGEPGLAYLTLGKDPPKEPEDLFKPAKWSAEQLAEADAEICRVAEHIVEAKFWPPASEAPDYDDFACILQEGVFGREAFH
ncbi:MAG TPA: PD-(D/E)XK nuclease family protein [Caulifigura sp.]|nr:PD-(D/E)XK nuclease family protein [Caulifigura sp.]